MRQGIFFSLAEPMARVNAAGLMVSLATFQDRSGVVDALGQVDLSDWVDVAGLVDIPCMMSSQVLYRPNPDAAMRKTQEIDTLALKHLLLNAYYPGVLQRFTVLVDGVRHEVMAVEPDSQMSQTRCAVRLWTQ